MDSNAAFLLACNDVHEGKVQEALTRILGKLLDIPEIVVRSRLLPKLCVAAQKSDIAQHQWFFKKDERPQLLEIIEVPLTSIYGSRITRWTFFQPLTLDFGSHMTQMPAEVLSSVGMLQRPVLFAITGHGPGPVCARVSAILNDLANERNCPSDLILAGASFFDLTANPVPSHRRATWNREELLRRVTDLANRLNVEEALQEVLQDEQKRKFLAAFAGRVLQPTIDTARESLAHVEAEMGFVVNKEIDARNHEAALHALNNHMSPSAGESFPVLVEYRRNSEPLRVKLPLLCLGIEDYERVVREYRRSVCEEMRKEWERRRRKYEEWSRQFASRFHHLRAELARNGSSVLSSRVIYIHIEIDPETATEHRLDPPKPETELEFLVKLPLMMIHQFAYWAWANYRIEALPEEEKFRSHWEQTCLVDAFLRGWPLPTEDHKLNAACSEWQKNWRLLALIALDNSLREQGLAVSDIAVENTVFRVVSEDDDYLTLGLFHIWDPHYDSLPGSKEGTTLFAPSFGKRRRDLVPARAAQKQAMDTMSHALASMPVSSQDLQCALFLDSGAALNLLIEHLCQPFIKDGLESDIERVMKKAVKRIDPLASFGLQEKFGKCSTLHDMLSLANECGEAGRKDGAVPDFLAWELYLVGEAVRNTVKNILEQIKRTSPLSFTGIELPNQLARRQPQLQLPHGVELDCISQMSDFTPWQIVAELIQQGPYTGTVEAILRFLEFPHMPAWLRDSYKRLRSKDRDYANRCLEAEGPPPRSHQLETQYAPGCFTGWDRVCYDIAEGDAALAFAWAIREGTGSTDRDALAKLLAAANNFRILQTFEHLTARRNELVADIEKFRRQGDRVSLGLAAASVRQALIDVLNIAESSYRRAALQDSDYGCGWLRLARLKWLTSQFREAFSVLVGPRPAAADLQACQLPLSTAVRAAGGSLSFTVTAPKAWNDPAGGAITVSRSEGDHLVLNFTVGTAEIGKCIISGLYDADMNLLGEFFRKYQPDMFQSAGRDTFEDWLCLVRVPSLGQRAAIADAVQGESEFALLAACIYLGVPEILGLPPGSSAKPRPPEWLEKNVVTALDWSP